MWSMNGKKKKKAFAFFETYALRFQSTPARARSRTLRKAT